MNFLAHFYLSANNTDLIIGNFLGDMMRKKEWETLPETIQKGVRMHQHIDYYTDNHPITKSHKNLINDTQGHYSGVVTDILYDHILAKNFSEYSNINLSTYSKNIYKTLEQNAQHFNEKGRITFHYMQLSNWLYSYRSEEGIHKILTGMYNRSGKRSNMNTAIEDYKKHQDIIDQEFNIFFEDLTKSSTEFITNL